MDIYLERVKEYTYSLLDTLPPIIKEKLSYISLGKSVRPKLLFEVANILGNDLDPLVPYASFVECIHSISIIQDDFIDQEIERRNERSLNAIFDTKTTLFTSTLILSRFYEKLLDISPPQNIVAFFSQKINELCIGEIAQDLSLETVNFEKSFKVIHQKTGALFALSFALPAFFNKKYEAYASIMEELGYLYGVFFQLSDDLNDLFEDVEPLFSTQQSPRLSFLLSLWNEKDNKTFEAFMSSKKKENLKQYMPFIDQELKKFTRELLENINPKITALKDEKLKETYNLLLRDYKQLLP